MALHLHNTESDNGNFGRAETVEGEVNIINLDEYLVVDYEPQPQPQPKLDEPVVDYEIGVVHPDDNVCLEFSPEPNKMWSMTTNETRDFNTSRKTLPNRAETQLALAPPPTTPPLQVKKKPLDDEFDDEFGPSVVLLHLFMIKIWNYEPGVFDFIKLHLDARMNGRFFFPQEAAATKFLARMESTISNSRYRVVRKCNADNSRKPGVGPKPWKTTVKLKSKFGPIWGARTNKVVLPCVLGCAKCGGSVAKCCSFKNSVLIGRVMLVLSILAAVIDVADIVVDIIYVEKLARLGHTTYAVVLGTTVVILIPLELFLKHFLFAYAYKQKLGQRQGLARNDNEQTRMYLICLALSELLIFLMEDTTTIMAWYMTGTFDGSAVAYANLYLTVGSGIVAAIGIASPFCEGMFFGKDSVMRNIKSEWGEYLTKRRNKEWKRVRSTHRACCGLFYLIAMWVATESLIVFWSWVSLARVATDKYDEEVPTNTGLIAAYVLGWIVSISGLITFFVCIQKDKLPKLWQPLYAMFATFFLWIYFYRSNWKKRNAAKRLRIRQENAFKQARELLEANDATEI